MILSSSQSIRQILRQRPMAAGLLEQEFEFHIWNRMEEPLSDLCRENGTDTHTMMQGILALTPPPAETGWDKHRTYWLIDLLTREHAAFRDTDMPAIQALLEEERRLPHPDGFVAHQLAEEFAHFRADFEKHMTDEEEFLFPKILRNEACFQYPELEPEPFRGSVNLYLKLDRHKPDEAFGRTLDSLRAKLRNRHLHRDTAELAQRVLAALDGFAHRLNAHAALESGILFPRAGRLEQELYEGSAPGMSRFPGDQ